MGRRVYAFGDFFYLSQEKKSMALSEYLEQLSKRYAAGMAREHAYRSDLESLLRALAPGVEVTNEPANVTDCGNPDFVLTRGKIPIGYIEAKDIGKDLNSKSYQEQFDRYRRALDNLIITDYLWFRFYQNGDLVHEIRVGEIEGGKIKPLPAHFGQFENLIADYISFQGQTIKNAQKLAEMMAAKARLLQNILENAAASDDESSEVSTELKAQLAAFREILIHDLTPRAFADLYAQTLAYGMFAARLYDTTLDTFSRQEAAELIPKSNPFLRKLFGHIAGPDIDSRIRPVVDNLADVFRATDVAALLSDFGQKTGQTDPVIHFYESFLAAYDPSLRKSRGVWYTPEPVVRFMVRNVDELLKTEFDLPQGLADISRGSAGEAGPHRVQILDPATGTGTFLAEIIRYVYTSRFQSMPGIWSSYVDEHLVPRLHGFELLMASYAMAHLKLSLLLKETGYVPVREQRIRIYLANALEESHPDAGTLFASWLSTEANEANRIKRDTSVMVVIGNPPYSGHSANKGKWIEALLEDYKKEPGGGKLKEKNPKWINDDYVKFIRLGQHFIEKNGEGILAFINNHSFLDNPTFRGMRWSLLKTFDTIHVVDLHGNAKKKETAPDGSPDQNVFDIQQGVSISFFVKNGKKGKEELAKVFHQDIYGTRPLKHSTLFSGSLKSMSQEALLPVAPHYFFVPKNFTIEHEYSQGFALNVLFPLHSVGVVTARDAFSIHKSPQAVWDTVQTFLAMGDEPARARFKLGPDVQDWSVSGARADLLDGGPHYRRIVPLVYRPFDIRFTYYTGKSNGFHCRPRGKVMQHFLNGENIGLCTTRRIEGNRPFRDVFVFNKIIQHHALSLKEVNDIAPLYLYPANSLFSAGSRTPNLDMGIVDVFARALGLRFTPEKEAAPGTFAPIDLLDYVYAFLHSPSYRERYQEFLKVDYPRVPYPGSAEVFWQLVAYGGALRVLHLLASPMLERFLTAYPIGGGNEVTSVRFEAGRVWINEAQYFRGVPESTWAFHIGGYQPAQRWLKDRQGQVLGYEDILHYQRIIVALAESERIMGEIDRALGF
jgi:hypothetical protein